MKTMKNLIVVFFGLASLLNLATADTVTLKNGTVLKGKVQMGTSSSLLFDTEDGRRLKLTSSDFEKYVVDTNTGSGGQPATPTTRPTASNARELNDSKNFSAALQEAKDCAVVEILAYNNDVETMTQIQKEARLILLLQKIQEIKKKSTANITDIVKVVDVVVQQYSEEELGEQQVDRVIQNLTNMQINRNHQLGIRDNRQVKVQRKPITKYKSTYTVKGVINDFDYIFDITMGNNAEKLNKSSKYKFTAVASFGVVVENTRGRGEFVGSDWNADSINKLAKNLSAGGALKLGIAPSISSANITPTPVDDEVPDTGQKTK